jgi:hypothetical protein
VIVKSNIPEEEPFFVGKILSVTGRSPFREIVIQWFEEERTRRTLYGNGKWILSGYLKIIRLNNEYILIIIDVQDNIEENSIIFEFESFSKNMKLLKSTKKAIDEESTIPWSLSNRDTRNIQSRIESENESNS